MIVTRAQLITLGRVAGEGDARDQMQISVSIHTGQLDCFELLTSGSVLIRPDGTIPAEDDEKESQ